MDTPEPWKQYDTATQLAVHACANHMAADFPDYPPEPHRCLMLDSLELALLPDHDAAAAGRVCRLFRSPACRCNHFEDALLPAATPAQLRSYARLISPTKKKARLTEDGLRKLLGRPSAAAEAEAPTDRTCTCGAALDKRRRMCDQCARTARKKTYRATRAKRRGTVPQLTDSALLDTTGVMASQNGTMDT